MKAPVRPRSTRRGLVFEMLKRCAREQSGFGLSPIRAMEVSTVISGSRVKFVVAVGVLLVFCGVSWAQQPPWAADRVFNLDDVEIELFNPACFGNCPVYTVTIEGTGAISYSDDALRLMDQAGLKLRLEPEQVVELLDQLLALQFFDLPNEYDSGARAFVWPPGSGKFRITQRVTTMDSSFTEIRLRIAEHTKSVRMWSGYGPPKLLAVAKSIDELVGTAGLYAIVKQEASSGKH